MRAQQIDKKKHIINKLQIKENMNVLDIGCGWGGMAIEIAKQTGANVKGITLSENQFATASKRAQAEGLAEKVSFAIQDYRIEAQKYDRNRVNASCSIFSDHGMTLPTRRNI